jgi:hypothetical protein
VVTLNPCSPGKPNSNFLTHLSLHTQIPRVQTVIHTYIHSFIHTCIHSYKHAFIHSHIHAFIHSCIHTYINSYIHTCIHWFPFKYLFIQRAFIHSFVFSFIHSFFNLVKPLLTRKVQFQGRHWQLMSLWRYQWSHLQYQTEENGKVKN